MRAQPRHPCEGQKNVGNNVVVFSVVLSLSLALVANVNLGEKLKSAAKCQRKCLERQLLTNFNQVHDLHEQSLVLHGTLLIFSFRS